VIKRLLGFGHKLRAHLSQRERRIYLVYGLVATVSSLSLLSFGFVRLGSYLIDKHQPMALLLLVSYTGLRSGRRFRRLFGGRSARPDVDDDGDVVTAQADGDADGPGSPRRSSASRSPPLAAAGDHVERDRGGRPRDPVPGPRAAAHRRPFTVLPEENADVRRPSKASSRRFPCRKATG